MSAGLTMGLIYSNKSIFSRWSFILFEPKKKNNFHKLTTLMAISLKSKLTLHLMGGGANSVQLFSELFAQPKLGIFRGV